MNQLPTRLGQETLAALRAVLPIAGASLYGVDSDGEPFGHLLDELPADQLREYQAFYRKLDPLHPTRFQTGSKGIVSLDQARNCANSERYVTGFVQRRGYSDEVELFFRDHAGVIMLGIGLFRTDRHGRFRSHEIELLDRMRPVLEFAFRTQMDGVGACEPSDLFCSFGLTDREIEIVALVRRGLSNGEIAGRLGIRLATVKAHLFNAFGKAGVNSRTELVSRLWRH